MRYRLLLTLTLLLGAGALAAGPAREVDTSERDRSLPWSVDLTPAFPGAAEAAKARAEGKRTEALSLLSAQKGKLDPAAAARKSFFRGVLLTELDRGSEAVADLE